MNRLLLLSFAMTTLFWAGCQSRPGTVTNQLHSNNQSKQTGAARSVLDPCQLIQAPHSGDTRSDREIIRLQQSLPTARDAVPVIERLGWMFIGKARTSFDPGFFKLAEQCAACLDARKTGSAEALLLRGHVLQNLHHFKEAERVARQLVTQRGLPFDFGLLGDVLMELGRLTEAIDAYQKMVDMKPDAQAYARVAHIRWLTGDLPGAVEVMRMAASACSPQAAEGAAWIYSRLAFYEWLAGEREAANQSCATALQLQMDYPPALLLRGRIRLADGQSAEAVEPLLRAARLNPLPEYQWTLAEALRAAGRTVEAEEVEAWLLKTGAIDDPRTFALFLATRGQRADEAIVLAEREFNERADVHTHDALAWALAAGGRWAEAEAHARKAVAEGTEDARLQLHAGIIAAKMGRTKEAGKLLSQAAQRRQMLLPSERAQLESARRELSALNPAPRTALAAH